MRAVIDAVGMGTTANSDPNDVSGHGYLLFRNLPAAKPLVRTRPPTAKRRTCSLAEKDPERHDLLPLVLVFKRISLTKKIPNAPASSC